MRRYWWVPVGAGVVLLGVAAFSSFQVANSSGHADAYKCSPRPCANPSGFGAYFSAVQVADGRLTMQVAFINHPHQQTFADSNHTSPADFQLRYPDGTQVKPVFSDTCPDWPELRIKIGDRGGPELLCFQARPGGTHGTHVIWGPDLGFLFDDVEVPLEP